MRSTDSAWKTAGASEARRGAKPNCGLFGSRNGPNMVFVGGGIPLEGLRVTVGVSLGGVQVLDKTGVTDKFNLLLEFVIDENTPGASRFASPFDTDSANVAGAPTIFTALEEQLGLKLEPARAPREFIVIDRVERPS